MDIDLTAKSTISDKLNENDTLNIYYEDNDVILLSDLAHYTKVMAHSERGFENRLGWIEIMFCLNGTVQWQLNGEQHQTLKNSIIILPSRFVVDNMMVSLDAQMVDISLSNQLLSQLLGFDIDKWNSMMYVGGIRKIELQDEQVQCIMQYFNLMTINQHISKVYYAKIVRSFIQIMLYTVLNNFVEQNRGEESPQINVLVSHSKQLFDNFLNLLNQSKPKRHPIGYFADKLSITPKYLSNLCTKYSGKTAADWIQEAVQEEVRYYLRQTLLSMKDVAHTTGFDNVAFFGRYVKHHFGCTPLEYRRKNV